MTKTRAEAEPRKTVGSRSTAPAEAAARRAVQAAEGAVGVVVEAAEAAIARAKQATRPPTSTTHVDLIKNEWLAGYQHVVARVRLVDEDRVEVDASDAQWAEVAMRPFGGIDPATEPHAFLGGLSEHLQGTYLFATEPHDEESCPYKDVVVPIRSVSDSLLRTEAV